MKRIAAAVLAVGMAVLTTFTVLNSNGSSAQPGQPAELGFPVCVAVAPGLEAVEQPAIEALTGLSDDYREEWERTQRLVAKLKEAQGIAGEGESPDAKPYPDFDYFSVEPCPGGFVAPRYTIGLGAGDVVDAGSGSPFTIHVFVMEDSEFAEAVDDNSSYHREPFQQHCGPGGHSCDEVTTALFVPTSTIKDPEALLTAMEDATGLRWLRDPIEAELRATGVLPDKSHDHATATGVPTQDDPGSPPPGSPTAGTPANSTPPPATSRSIIAFAEEILALLQERDLRQLSSLLVTYHEACGLDVPLGVPCPPGLERGTEVEVLRTNYCPESRPLPVEDLDDSIDFFDLIEYHLQPGLEFEGLFLRESDEPRNIPADHLLLWKSDLTYYAMYIAPERSIVALGGACDLETALPQTGWRHIWP